MTNLELQKELQNANELIKELRNENDYKEAYIRVLQVAETNILSYEMANALSFIKDNRLGGYANYFCAGEYLEEALSDYFEECGIDDLDSIARNNFNDWLRCEGLLAIAGEKMLKEASAFLGNESTDILDFVDLRSDSTDLYLQNGEEVEKMLRGFIKQVDFEKLDLEAEKGFGSDFKDYFAFKCLVRLINECKERNA
ncbi:MULTISPECIES: hypothetical protein [Campylobacter]|uniref:hypothetical protein n=1 Tax=Campylobacter TaxID=194 RepID=UPI002149B282|nr:hypothetical protein [Campylobacter helveticus]MCR2067221.1 hypothetical protein [Campylobacter helveticus]MDL0100953.1 hypothetical protein [Campylobacter felis]